jgi:hypothetical protein
VFVCFCFRFFFCFHFNLHSKLWLILDLFLSSECQELGIAPSLNHNAVVCKETQKLGRTQNMRALTKERTIALLFHLGHEALVLSTLFSISKERASPFC